MTCVFIIWKHFPRYWPFVRGTRRRPVNSPQKGQWREALMFSLICAWMNDWVNSREAVDLRRHRTNYDVTVMRLHIPNSLLRGFIYLLLIISNCTLVFIIIIVIWEIHSHSYVSRLQRNLAVEDYWSNLLRSLPFLIVNHCQNTGWLLTHPGLVSIIYVVKNSYHFSIAHAEDQENNV